MKTDSQISWGKTRTPVDLCDVQPVLLKFSPVFLSAPPSRLSRLAPIDGSHKMWN